VSSFGANRASKFENFSNAASAIAFSEASDTASGDFFDAAFGPFRFGVFLLRTLAGFCPVAAVVVFSAFAFGFRAFGLSC
jgi:hypothetical protein